ncbi:MAG: hypothetical protein RLZZ408_1784 [Verrucomicrobiota bacterium]|jgi:hypothetical protein
MSALPLGLKLGPLPERFFPSRGESDGWMHGGVEHLTCPLWGGLGYGLRFGCDRGGFSWARVTIGRFASRANKKMLVPVLLRRKVRG